MLQSLQKAELGGAQQELSCELGIAASSSSGPPQGPEGNKCLLRPATPRQAEMRCSSQHGSAEPPGWGCEPSLIILMNIRVRIATNEISHQQSSSGASGGVCQAGAGHPGLFYLRKALGGGIHASALQVRKLGPSKGLPHGMCVAFCSLALSLAFKHFLTLCVYLCVCANATVCVCRSEDSLQESVLSFHHMHGLQGLT